MCACVHVAQEDLARSVVWEASGLVDLWWAGVDWSVGKHLFGALAFLNAGCRVLPWASLLEVGGDYHFPQLCPVSRV